MEKTNKQLILELAEGLSNLSQQLKKIQTVQKQHDKILTELSETLALTKTQSFAASGNSAEATWAEIFNNTISQTTWLQNKKFSPGRWAAGYPFMYALYRTLDEFHPHSILELGLGQTTKMISQYVSIDKSIKHIVVEHDEDWVNFYNNSSYIPSNTNIRILPLIQNAVYKDDSNVYAYDGFAECFLGKKFDLISIDAPFGGYAKIYARVDVLSVLPDCLADSFVIFIDDSNRIGEKNTIKEILSVLNEHGIEYSTGEYRGKKFTYIITSIDLKYLCTM